MRKQNSTRFKPDSPRMKNARHGLVAAVRAERPDALDAPCLRVGEQGFQRADLVAAVDGRTQVFALQPDIAQRRQMVGALSDLKFGKRDARELFVAMKGFADYPKAGEQLEALKRESRKELVRTYGQRTDRMLAGARKLMVAMDKRAPGMMAALDNGLGSDLKFTQAMIRAAKRHGLA